LFILCMSSLEGDPKVLNAGLGVAIDPSGLTALPSDG
jgi:hypothetical protein